MSEHENHENEDQPEVHHEVNEDQTGTPCPGCGEVHLPATTNMDPASIARRVLTDEAGEEYVSFNDLRTFMQTLINVQSVMGKMIGDMMSSRGEESEAQNAAQEIGLQSMVVFGSNIIGWCKNAPAVAPSSVQDVPDSIPADWTEPGSRPPQALRRQEET